MKAVQVSKPGGNFEVVERPIPEPGRAQVRIKVEACGVCYSDAIVKETGFPRLQYPRVPGHEIAGKIDAVGADVTQWKPGQRVGVGWHGGHCFKCDPCRRGHFILCQFEKITGISFDGGYAEYVVVPAIPRRGRSVCHGWVWDGAAATVMPPRPVVARPRTGLSM